MHQQPACRRQLGLLKEVGVLVAEGQDGTAHQQQHQHGPRRHQLPDGAQVDGAATVLAGLVKAGLESGQPEGEHPVGADHVPAQQEGGQDPVHHAERARREGQVTVRAARAEVNTLTSQDCGGNLQIRPSRGDSSLMSGNYA